MDNDGASEAWNEPVSIELVSFNDADPSEEEGEMEFGRSEAEEENSATDE